MSKILDTLVAATKLKKARGQDDVEYVEDLIVAVGELNDAAWDKLGTEAQDWFNDAADAKNSGKAIPAFPDAEEEPAAKPARGSKAKEEPAAKPARGSKAKAAPEPEDSTIPEVGDTVIITTKRGKVVEGELVEVDGDIAVVLVDGEEQEFQKDRVESIVKKDEDEAEEEEATDAEPQEGDEVTVVTKRGKSVTGEVIEIDDDIIVLDVDGKEEEFDRARLESITIAGEEAPEPEAKPARGSRKSAPAEEEEPAPATTSRRGSAAKPAAEKEAPKKISAKANGGVSATSRMRELILDDLDAKVEDIGKALKKEKLEFRDNTLSLVYSDVHKIISMLKERKMLKVAK